MEESERRISLDDRLKSFTHLLNWTSRMQNAEDASENDSLVINGTYILAESSGSTSQNVSHPFQCQQCAGLYKNRLQLRKHLYSAHKVENSGPMKGSNYPRKCPYPDCEDLFSNDGSIRNHLTNIHLVKANQCIELTFSSISVFGHWQTKLQDEIGVWYKKISTYVRKDGVKVTSLRCQSGEARSGVLKEQMERYCPSAIILTSSNNGKGVINGKYYPNHYGHYARSISVETLREAAGNAVCLDEFPNLVSSTADQSSSTPTEEQPGTAQSPMLIASSPALVNSTPSPVVSFAQIPILRPTHPPTINSAQLPTLISAPPLILTSTRPPLLRPIQLPILRPRPPPALNSALRPTFRPTQTLIFSSASPQISAVTQPQIYSSTQPTAYSSTQLSVYNSTQPHVYSTTRPPAFSSTLPLTLNSTQSPIFSSAQSVICSSTQPSTYNSTQAPMNSSTLPLIISSTQPSAISSTQSPTISSTQTPAITSTQSVTCRSSKSPIFSSRSLISSVPPLRPLTQSPRSSVIQQFSSSFSIERLASPHEQVLNLSVSRVNIPSSPVSAEPSPAVSSEYRRNGTNGNAEKPDVKQPILSLNDLKSAVKSSEMSLSEAMEWTRNSFLIGDNCVLYEDAQKDCERIRKAHVMWYDKQKACKGSEGTVSSLLAKLAPLEHENPVTYEDIIDDDDLENEENYLIVIMNSIQGKLLREFGECGIVCVDIILEGGCEGALSMMSVNVIDAMGEPLPCAIAISDRSNRSVARQFFTLIKSKTGIVTPRIFICGQEEFHEQWRNVMAESQQIFLASWLVDSAWRNWIASQKMTSDEQLALYVLLRGLMEMTTLVNFETKVRTVMKEILPNYNLDAERCLLSKSKLWAFCYRHLEVRNCDLKLETLHQEMLAFNLPLTDALTKRLDALLLTLLDVVRRKCCERLTRIEPCVTPRLALIERRHDESFLCDVLEIQSLLCNERWMVKTRDGSCYVWKTDLPPCEFCKLSCSECDICIHKFMCTCFDNLILCNLCVHLHIVSRHIKNSSAEQKQSEVCCEFSCSECEQCRAEQTTIEEVRADLLTRNAKLVEKLKTLMDLETLLVVKESFIAIQNMMDACNGS